MDAFTRQHALKMKIAAGQPTLGLFVRTPSAQIVELLATTELDFIVLDAEHAPFGTTALDHCLLAARAVDIPALVRVPGLSPSIILKVLDLGAAGIVVPHIQSADDAANAVAATRYSGGTRGYSGSHRAAAYGAMPAKVFVEQSDRSTIVIAQIENAHAVDNIDEIAAVTTIDALLIGPADLAVSYGIDFSDQAVIDRVVGTVCTSAGHAGRTVGLFLPSTDGVADARARGMSLFMISTDQALLIGATSAVVQSFGIACNGNA